MIQACTHLYSSKYFPQWGKEGTDHQIFNEKLIDSI